MSLISRFSSEFDRRIRNRGLSYYEDRLVEIKSGDENRVIAYVLGSHYYRIQLSIEGMALVVSCSCPYFDEDVCKHIWATLLAAEARGFLGRIPPPTRLRLADDEDDFDDEVDGADDEDNDGIGYTPPVNKKPRAASPALPQPASWKRQLAFLQQTAQAPGGREVVYVIDGPATRAGGELIVDVMYRDRKQSGEWGKLKSQSFTGSTLARIPNPEDRRLPRRRHGHGQDGGDTGAARMAPPVARCRGSEPRGGQGQGQGKSRDEEERPK